MAAGHEIRRLRGKIAAARVAQLIGIDVGRLRKWEERDTDPKDTGDIQKIETYFGRPLKELPEIKSFEFVQKPTRSDAGIKDDLIEALKESNRLLKEALEVNSDELHRNILLTRSLAETNQDILIELLAKQRKQDQKTVVLEMNKANADKLHRMQAEDNLSGRGKRRIFSS